MAIMGCPKYHLTISRAVRCRNSNLNGGLDRNGLWGFILKFPARRTGQTDKKKRGRWSVTGAERRIMMPDADQPDENAENRFTVRSAFIVASFDRSKLTFHQRNASRNSEISPWRSGKKKCRECNLEICLIPHFQWRFYHFWLTSLAV